MPEFRDVIPGSQVSVSQPTLAGLQAALAAGTLTSAALTSFYLQRVDRLNPALHAVITVNLDAPAEAAASDAVRAAAGPRGPLEGIPVLVTYHPAYLLPHRNPGAKKEVWEDMKLLLTQMGRPIPITKK